MHRELFAITLHPHTHTHMQNALSVWEPEKFSQKRGTHEKCITLAPSRRHIISQGRGR